MAGQRPFRFGVQAVNAVTRDDWVAKAVRAEGLGYATFVMPDHLGAQLAPVPALMAAAEATVSLRVGAFVFDNDFRHPVVLAKEVATLDLLSEGRVEFGIGAGWLHAECEAAGMAFDPAGVRISRMEEALQVIKGLWGERPFSFAGEHYTVAVLDGMPKPVQRPHPPILIGGGGRRLLSIAAREADIVGLNPQARPDGTLDWTTTSAEAVTERVGWLREAAGERLWSGLELNLTVTVAATTDRQSAAQQIAERWSVTSEHVLESPFALVGEPDRIAEQLQERRERFGISYITVGEHGMDALAPVVARLAGK